MQDPIPPTVEAWTRLLDRSGAETASYRSSVTRLDERGNPVEEIQFALGGAVERKRTFGPGGRILEETTFNADGSEKDRSVYRHDESGREVEQTLLLSDGKPHGRWVSIYDDASGRLVKRVWHNREGIAEVTETFTYDEAGRLIGKTRGNVASWTYDYDEKDRLVRTRGGYYSSDEPDDEQLEYDAQGRLAQRTRFYPAGEVRSVTTLHREDGPGRGR